MTVRFEFTHYMGMNTLVPVQNMRDQADLSHLHRAGLVGARPRCSVKHVVAALPQGTEVYSLIRYPSPHGHLRVLARAALFYLTNKTLRGNVRVSEC